MRFPVPGGLTFELWIGVYDALTEYGRGRGGVGRAPKHILNAPTRLLKELDYRKGYACDHDTDEGFSGQDYFPEGMKRKSFYQTVERGFKREIAKRLAYWARLRKGHNT